MSKDKRRKLLEKRLILWSFADQINKKALNHEINNFRTANKKSIEQIQEIDKKIEELESQKTTIAKNTISACNENIGRVQSKTKNAMVKSLIDLAFWNEMSDKIPETYQVLHPYLDEIGDEEKDR